MWRRIMCRAPGLADSPDSCAGKEYHCIIVESIYDECVSQCSVNVSMYVCCVALCGGMRSSGRSEELSWLMLHSVYLWFAQDPGLISWPWYPG